MMSQKMQRLVAVGFGAIDFLAHAARHDGQGDELGMGMFERGAGGFTVILKMST